MSDDFKSMSLARITEELVAVCEALDHIGGIRERVEALHQYATSATIIDAIRADARAAVIAEIRAEADKRTVTGYQFVYIADWLENAHIKREG